MFGCFRRPEHDEPITVGLDDSRQVVAISRRHMARPAMRTVVVAHARPFVCPGRIAAGASVVVEEPGHLFAVQDTIAVDFQESKPNRPKTASDKSRARQNRDTLDHARLGAVDGFSV